MPEKYVVFDLVGTLASYQVLDNAVEARLGDKLRQHGVNPALFTYCWIEVAEREYTYLSMSGRYVTFSGALVQLFYRIVAKSGIPNARTFASEDDVGYIMDQYQKLSMRPGVQECLAKLRDAGFKVLGLTMASTAEVADYFQKAGVSFPAEDITSSDSSKTGKPDPQAYLPLFQKLKKETDEVWFAAAHCWDASAAKRVGFKAAYTTVHEGEYLQDLFGELDVVSDDLVGLAEGIIKDSA